MGFVSKARTRSRTAPAMVDVPGEDWALDILPTASALIRAALAVVAGQRTRSSAFRGHDSFGIGSALASGDSTLWYEQTGFSRIFVALGIDSTAGARFDWSLRFTGQHQGERCCVAVETPTVLTTDGALVNADSYDEFRQLVMADLRRARPVTLDMRWRCHWPGSARRSGRGSSGAR